MELNITAMTKDQLLNALRCCREAINVRTGTVIAAVEIDGVRFEKSAVAKLTAAIMAELKTRS
jgi:hypothetical protein